MKEQAEKKLENQNVWSALVKSKYILNGVSFFLLALITVGSSAILILVDNGYRMNTLEIVLAVACGVLMIGGLFLCSQVRNRLDSCSGYYRCKKCGHTYAPTKKELSESLFFFRYNWSQCPKCKKNRWQKKVRYRAIKTVCVDLGKNESKKNLTAVRKSLRGVH